MGSSTLALRWAIPAAHFALVVAEASSFGLTPLFHRAQFARRSFHENVLHKNYDAFRCDTDTERRSHLLSYRGGSSLAGASPSSPQSLEDLKTYHLIWSPGFLKKLLSSTLALFALRYILPFPTSMHAPACHNVDGSILSKLAQRLILPLLSSSCCALQLLINALAGAGCAGFNTYLGPIRPYFVSFLLYSAVITFPGIGQGIRQWGGTTLLSFAVAFMPEVLHIWNNKLSKRRSSRPSDVKVSATIHLCIPSMGCVACVNKIDTCVRQCSPQVIESRSWLTEKPKGGHTKILLAAHSTEEIETLTDSIANAVEGAGFPCEVETVDVRKDSAEEKTEQKYYHYY